MSDALQDQVRRTLLEWDAVVERQKQVGPAQVRHGQELLSQLEQAERRLGTDLSNFKRALRAR